MSVLRTLIERMRGVNQEPEEELPDDETRDKHLRSLRREMRVINEEEEKEFLKKRIAEIRRDKVRENLFGIKDKIERQKSLIQKGKQVKILHNSNMLGTKKMRPKKHAKGFLGKGFV